MILDLVIGLRATIQVPFTEEGSLNFAIELYSQYNHHQFRSTVAIINTELDMNVWPSWTQGHVTGFQFESGLFVVANSEDVVRDDNEQRGIIGGSFSSSFAGAVSRYMLTPDGLIINPYNPTDFVYPGSMVYVPSASNEQPRLFASVRLSDTIEQVGSGTELAGEFSLNPASSHDRLPIEIVENLLRRIRALQIRTEVAYIGDSIVNIHIPDCTPDSIERFPTLLFTIRSNDENVGVIRLTGSDYIRYTNINMISCDLTIAATGNNFSIGSNTLSKIVIYIDNEQRVIGFADPI